MSKLSAQCDELRTMAAMLVMKGLPEVASAVRDAADTIFELRDDLHRANAENASLQEYIRRRKVQQDYIKLYGDNIKLRNMCAMLYDFAHDENPDGTELDFADKLRMLGIEVGA